MCFCILSEMIRLENDSLSTLRNERAIKILLATDLLKWCVYLAEDATRGNAIAQCRCIPMQVELRLRCSSESPIGLLLMKAWPLK